MDAEAKLNIFKKKSPMRSIIRITFLLTTIVFVTSCIPLNSMQTGRTVGKGASSGSGSYNVGKLDPDVFTADGGTGYNHIIELQVNHGITEKMDVLAKINSSLYMSAGGKFQFAGNDSSILASSIGLELGVQPVMFPFGVLFLHYSTLFQ